MSKVPLVLNLATLFLIISFFTCGDLLTDPYKDPSNLKIGLSVNGNATIIQQNDSVTIGVRLISQALLKV
jgi:hypothetical protein